MFRTFLKVCVESISADKNPESTKFIIEQLVSQSNVIGVSCTVQKAY